MQIFYFAFAKAGSHRVLDAGAYTVTTETASLLNRFP